MSRYTQIDSGETEHGNDPWRIGLVRGRMVVMWGRLTMTPADQDAFADAVARAVTPGQTGDGRRTHGPGHGCTPCRAEWPAEARAEDDKRRSEAAQTAGTEAGR